MNIPFDHAVVMWVRSGKKDNQNVVT